MAFINYVWAIESLKSKGLAGKIAKRKCVARALGYQWSPVAK